MYVKSVFPYQCFAFIHMEFMGICHVDNSKWFDHLYDFIWSSIFPSIVSSVVQLGAECGVTLCTSS